MVHDHEKECDCKIAPILEQAEKICRQLNIPYLFSVEYRREPGYCSLYVSTNDLDDEVKNAEMESFALKAMHGATDGVQIIKRETSKEQPHERQD